MQFANKYVGVTVSPLVTCCHCHCHLHKLKELVTHGDWPTPDGACSVPRLCWPPAARHRRHNTRISPHAVACIMRQRPSGLRRTSDCEKRDRCGLPRLLTFRLPSSFLSIPAKVLDGVRANLGWVSATHVARDGLPLSGEMFVLFVCLEEAVVLRSRPMSSAHNTDGPARKSVIAPVTLRVGALQSALASKSGVTVLPVTVTLLNMARRT